MIQIHYGVKYRFKDIQMKLYADVYMLFTYA